MSRWVSQREAAELLGVSDRHVRGLLDLGLLDGEVINGRRTLYRESVLALRRRRGSLRPFAASTVWAVARVLAGESTRGIDGLGDAARVRRYARDLTFDVWSARASRRGRALTVRHDERLWDFLATDPSTRIGRLEGLDSIGFLYVTQSRLKVASGYFDVAADRHGELILTVVPKFPPTAATGEVPDALTLLDAVEQGLLGGSDGVERFRRLQRR